MMRMNFTDHYFLQELVEDWLTAGIPETSVPDGILYDDSLFTDFWSTANRIGAGPMHPPQPAPDHFQYDKFRARVRK